jgi:hypothetical protein
MENSKAREVKLNGNTIRGNKLIKEIKKWFLVKKAYLKQAY